MIATESTLSDRGQVSLDDLSRMADGLDVLIRFHDREIDQELLSALQADHIASGFKELSRRKETDQEIVALGKALRDLGQAPDAGEMDDLAAEFADLYLTHGYRVSPSGSVWLTEDKLERQLPMFDVREWYEHYGISVPNWRVRADDHLVHELQFVSFLCRHGDAIAARDAAGFLDLHVLPWIPEFCQRAAQRVQHPVYRALMQLTDAFLEDLRSALETFCGKERKLRVVINLDTQRAPEPEAAPYVPGLAESW